MYGLGGNIGKSFAWQVAEENFDCYVLELSSFQLDGIRTSARYCYNNQYKSGSFGSI